MIKIVRNFDLTPYTTLKIAAKAAYFAVIKSEKEIQEAISFARGKKIPIFVLGGGSNILISRPLRALVLKNEIKGLREVRESSASVWVEANSGEWWSSLVHYSINRNLGGIENLYYVPGTVGAAPVQNIGAYGCELKDSFYNLRAIDLSSGKEKIFTKSDCLFAYRESIFKHRLKGRYFIVAVTLRLSKKPILLIDYGDIKMKLLELGFSKPGVREVAEAIRLIRDSKLPNPAILSNAGSFFKNPEVAINTCVRLTKKFPDFKCFPSEKKGKMKIPAGWLIEKAGFKGKRYGQVGMYEKQALILVNYGGASARQVLRHVSRVQDAVKNMFSIKIEPEVNII